MAYPGESYKMANYGWKNYTPDQAKEQWRESVHRENKIAKYHSAESATRKSMEDSSSDTTRSTINYYDNQKTYTPLSTYDRTFHIKEGYCIKLKRDDMEHTQRLNVHAEEVNKDVPIVTSSEYGHRPPLEHPHRKHVRIGLVQREFYRSCGTNIL